MNNYIKELKAQAEQKHIAFNALTHFLFIIDGFKYYFSFSSRGHEYSFKKHYMNDRTGFVASLEVLSYLVLNDLISTEDNKINLVDAFGKNGFEAKEIYFMFDNSKKEPTLPALTAEEAAAADTQKAIQGYDVLQEIATKNIEDLKFYSEQKGDMKKMNKIETLIQEVKSGIYNPETLKHFTIKTSRTTYKFAGISKATKKVSFINGNTILNAEFEVLERIVNDDFISTKDNKISLPYAWGKARNWYFSYDETVAKAEALEKARAAKEAKRLEAEKAAEAAAEAERMKKQAWESEVKTTVANMEVTSLVTFLMSVFIDVLGGTSELHAQLQVKNIIALYNLLVNDRCAYAMKELVNILWYENKASKAVFEQLSGFKLPRTDKGTRAVLEAIASGDTSELTAVKKYVKKSEKQPKESKVTEEYVLGIYDKIIKVEAIPFKHKCVNRDMFIAKVNKFYGLYDKACGMLVDATFKTKKELINHIQDRYEKHAELYANNARLIQQKEEFFNKALKPFLEMEEAFKAVEDKVKAKASEATQETTEVDEKSNPEVKTEEKIEVVVVTSAPEVAAEAIQETTEVAAEATQQLQEAPEVKQNKTSKASKKSNYEYIRFSPKNIMKVKATSFKHDDIDRPMFIAKVNGKYGLYDKTTGILLGRNASFSKKKDLMSYIEATHNHLLSTFENQKEYVNHLESAFKKELYDYKVKNEPDSIEACAENFKKLYAEIVTKNTVVSEEDTKASETAEKSQEAAEVIQETTEAANKTEAPEAIPELQEAAEYSANTSGGIEKFTIEKKCDKRLYDTILPGSLEKSSRVVSMRTCFGKNNLTIYDKNKRYISRMKHLVCKNKGKKHTKHKKKYLLTVATEAAEAIP